MGRKSWASRKSQFLCKGRKPLHIAKHHRDLFAFTFDSIPLGQDLVGQPLGKIASDLIQFLVKGEFYRSRIGWGDSQIMSALIAKLAAWRINRSTFRTDKF